MEGYNSKQKLYISIAIVVFVVINLIAVILALPYVNKGNVKGLYTSSLYDSVLVEGNIDKDIVLYADTEVNTQSNSLFIKNLNFVLATLPQSKLKVDGTKVDIRDGIYYLEANSAMSLITSKEVTVMQGSKIFFDAGEGNLYVLNGEINIEDKTFLKGSVINVNSDLTEYNILNKSQLLSTNKVKEMNALLARKSLFVEELNFISTPKLEILNNILEADSSVDSYNIQGKVDAGSFLIINREKVIPSPDGDFSYRIDLKQGLNDIRVVAIDEFANSNIIYLKINFTR